FVFFCLFFFCVFFLSFFCVCSILLCGHCLDARIGLDLLSSIPGMGVELELLHWEPLFLTLLSFRSLVRPTSGSSKSNPGETLFDMSSLSRVSGKTGRSRSLRLLATEL